MLITQTGIKKLTFMAEKFKYIASVHLLLIKDEKILLSRRFNTGFQDGNYSLPAGHMDGNETVQEAMVREAKEEIGITIKPEDLHVVHTMHRPTSNGEAFNFFLKAGTWQGEPTNMEPNKCDDLSWFSLNSLPENLVPYIRHGLSQTMNDITFSNFNQ